MAAKKIFQQEIPRRGTHCYQEKEILDPHMEYYSVLCEADDHATQRFDFCAKCWKEKAKSEWIAKAKSYWKAKVFSKKEIKPPDLSRDDRALALLKKAKATEGTLNAAELFVLALYLARRRILVLREDRKQPDSHTNLYEDIHSSEMYAIARVDLMNVQLMEIQKVLASKLAA